MAGDLVCGMKVDETTGFRLTYAGTTYYFCSIECRDMFARRSKAYPKDFLDTLPPTRDMDLGD